MVFLPVSCLVWTAYHLARFVEKLVETDILGSIETNQQLGNITPSDAHQLISLTKKLYSYLYETYTESEEVHDMIDQSLELEQAKR